MPVDELLVIVVQRMNDDNQRVKYLIFKADMGCRVCRARKHVHKAISSLKKSEIAFRNRLGKAAISSTVNYPIISLVT